MMTPQEAASSTFPKATLGGYNMAAVDVFLDKLIEDYTALYKENGALKSKIKVLVDKMEEYHAMEETMRSTLLTAQKMASTMVAEAEQKSAALVADGEKSVRQRVTELQGEVAAQEQRLAAARAEVDRKVEAEQERLTAAQQELGNFLKSYRKLCEKQLEFIDRLPELRLLPDGFEVPDAEPERPAAAPHTAPPVVAPVAQEITPQPVHESSEPAVAAAALEESEDFGGDAGALLESMQNVINVFSHTDESTVGVAETPAESEESLPDSLDFELNMVSGTAEEDPFADDSGDSEDDESATRVLNLDDLQFGRNYTKD